MASLVVLTPQVVSRHSGSVTLPLLSKREFAIKQTNLVSVNNLLNLLDTALFEITTIICQLFIIHFMSSKRSGARKKVKHRRMMNVKVTTGKYGFRLPAIFSFSIHSLEKGDHPSSPISGNEQDDWDTS